MTEPALHFCPELLLRAQSVKVLLLDVDGVLTDGSLYFSEHGETLKRFHTLDGQGLKLLQRAGIETVVITGRDARPLRLRLTELGLMRAYFGVENKLAVASAVLKEMGLDWQHSAAMGDDWPDLPLLKRSALACAPANAQIEVRALAHWVSQYQGGLGAVRELCDLLLTAGGRYAALLQEYLQ